MNIKLPHPNAKFPDATFRGNLIREAIEKYTIPRAIGMHVQSGMITSMQRYTMNIYALRDEAVKYIQDGFIAEGLEILAKIGEVK